MTFYHISCDSLRHHNFTTIQKYLWDLVHLAPSRQFLASMWKIHFKSQLTGLQEIEYNLALMLKLNELSGFRRKPVGVACGLLVPAGRTVCEWHFTQQISVWSLCGAAKRACVRRKVILSSIILFGSARAAREEFRDHVQLQHALLYKSQGPYSKFWFFVQLINRLFALIIVFFSHSSDSQKQYGK